MRVNPAVVLGFNVHMPFVSAFLSGYTAPLTPSALHHVQGVWRHAVHVVQE